MTYRTKYYGHGELLPDLIETVERLHADDGEKRLVFTRPGARPVSIRLRDGDPKNTSKIIEGLAQADVMDYDVTMLIFHNADGIQRALGWRLDRDVVVEIIPIAELAKILPAPEPGQFRTLAERRLDFAAL